MEIFVFHGNMCFSWKCFMNIFVFHGNIGFSWKCLMEIFVFAKILSMRVICFAHVI